jgi:hypothetical protein
METPLLFLFMMAALYALLRGWPCRAGFAADLLLLTRVDLVTWLVTLAFWHLWTKKRLPLRFIASAALTYAPWLVFAALQFGSAIPHTITAKWVHYQMGIASSLSRSAGDLFAWISPFGTYEIASVWRIGLAGLTFLLAASGATAARARSGLEVLWIFGLVEATWIVITGATFEVRYFVPMLSATLVLAGLGLGALFSRLSWSVRSSGTWCAAAVGCAAVAFFAVHSARHSRDVQLYRHERSLKEIGTWLSTHTPNTASVLLEPLGYAGYFADRRMIDEVGLVSPQVVLLGLPTFTGGSRDSVAFSRTLLSRIQPDYFVVHCDDALRVFSRALSERDTQTLYSRLTVIDPLSFDPNESPERQSILSDSTTDLREIARASCYEIWGENRLDNGP